jgi:hypothetical protein
MLESDVEDDLCRWAEANGVLCFKIKFEAERGAPDRLLILPGGEHVYVELKRPGGGRVSAQQEKIHKRLRDQGCFVIVGDDLEDILWAIDINNDV